MTILLHNEFVSEKKIENRSTLGEVMDNIIVDCFLQRAAMLALQALYYS